MTSKNLKQVLLIFVVGTLMYIFWQYLSITFFDKQPYTEGNYEKIVVKYTPEQIKQILFDETGDN